MDRIRAATATHAPRPLALRERVYDDADTDPVDLSATPNGQRIYERAGFKVTKAPRMKLVL